MRHTLRGFAVLGVVCALALAASGVSAVGADSVASPACAPATLDASD